MSAGWRGSAGQVRRNFRQLSPHRSPPTGQLDFFFHSCPPTGQLDFFSQLPPHRTTGFFFHSCRLRQQPRHFFSREESRPWRGLGRASMPGRWRGRAAPGVPSLNMSTRHVEAIRLRCRAGGAARRLGAAGTKPPNPCSPPRPCYTCYMCYMGLTRHATEPPQSPGSLLYVLYVLYGSHEHPLSPGSLLYVLYVLCGSHKASH